ncbi:putative tetratricopeptide-like helical domain superfamily [Helianthus annuus]|nr:putative tetratricopeptide-like helical domain superfamily [Helianthus annuus]KAJ0599667.1 putative tetratricopeptide-like helical domain superfamily [Helianthus annuus]KAJ0607174.1 putative tetratricopeptide-like helical domain superfamily [Helianthus annuus]KAJ0767233.1 putative tetratricopeptide-like helical domain superfamily [Helianthus annuus]KAJ0773081.1 putative tetratricopeptide-like helical domain superfamily [Helianthus annuus]
MSQLYQSGDRWTAIKCLLDMNLSNVKIYKVTFIMSLATVVQIGNLKLGEQIHGMTIKSGFDININVSSCLINMYLKMDCLRLVKIVFFNMNKTDLFHGSR